MDYPKVCKEMHGPQSRTPLPTACSRVCDEKYPSFVALSAALQPLLEDEKVSGVWVYREGDGEWWIRWRVGCSCN